jgi:hypothetical protein
MPHKVHSNLNFLSEQARASFIAIPLPSLYPSSRSVARPIITARMMEGDAGAEPPVGT